MIYFLIVLGVVVYLAVARAIFIKDKEIYFSQILSYDFNYTDNYIDFLNTYNPFPMLFWVVYYPLKYLIIGLYYVIKYLGIVVYNIIILFHNLFIKLSDCILKLLKYFDL